MRCIAYRASKNCVHAWKRCSGRAEKGSAFCRSHLRAICGVYLGLCVSGFPERSHVAPPGRNAAKAASAGAGGSAQ